MPEIPKTRAAARARRAAPRILTPTVRRWAYGVAIAAIPAAIALGWLPASAAPFVAPLVMALLYVDKGGKPIEPEQD